MEARLARLYAELRPVQLSDDNHGQKEQSEGGVDEFDEWSYRARRERCQQITRETRSLCADRPSS
jgi:hypothetical protein